MRPEDLQVLLRTWAPKLRREFLQAVAAAGEAISDTALLRAIRAQDVDAILAMVQPPDLTDATDTIAQSFIAGAVEGGVALERTHIAVLATLSGVNPMAGPAAAFAGQRIVEVSFETKSQVRDLIVNAFDQGVSPRDTSRLIRSIVGLGPRDVTALNNFTARLVDDGLGPTDVAGRAARYAQTLINRRGLTIARTEIMDASHAGQQALWDHAVTSGLLSETSEKGWLTGPNPCDDCDDLGDQVVAIGDDFDGPDGPIDGPTVHPNCECTVGLVSEKAG